MNNIENFISALTSAISNCSLYSKDHTSVDKFLDKSLRILEKLLKDSDKVEIMLIEDDIVINKSSYKYIGLQVDNLTKRLKRKGLSRIEFSRGVTFEEMRQFIAEMLETDEKMPTFSHIKMGVLDIHLEEAKTKDDFDSDDIPGFLSEQVELTKEIFSGIPSSQKVDIPRANKVIENFMSAFRRKASVLQLLNYAKSREEYSYIHATNVAVLSIFQMRTLGIREGVFLRDIGMAGLLHDVGKLFISDKTLGQKRCLNEKEWAVIKLHPLLGARFLSTVKGIAPLIPVVAFEHHLKYDGKGYPERQVCEKRQHICSQVVAVSDCFDALRSARPYRKSLEIREIFPILEKDAESAFNPFLLENFMRRMDNALCVKAKASVETL
jgi:HD-GYP domain-containing protein (c-di-GMP phosphodiesterase class II)